MSPDSPKASDRNPSNPAPTLADRVKARVAEAQRDLDKRQQNSDTRPKQRPTRLTKTSTSLTDTSADERELESLHRVYREMRTLYLGYRRRTGTPAVPELRTAVRAYKSGQSLTSLVQIAGFLDERKLLGW